MRRLAFLFVLLFSLPAFSQAKHPFTFEDMMKLKRVGEPVPSPDGKWVLFAAVDVDLAANKKTSHIWIVPLTTQGSSTPQDTSPSAKHPAPVGMTSSGERILIPDQDGDRPRWAPDGKRFAFLSNKEGGSQIWIADFDGAAGTVSGAHRLTSIATEAGGELWSPDGKNILFTSDVYPECPGQALAEETCNAKKLEEHEKSKVKALIFDHLLYRHWNAYKEGKRTHIFLIAAQQSAPIIAAGNQLRTMSIIDTPANLTPGNYDSPEFSLGGQDNYAFSPDGQEICYTSNHDKVEATSTNNDLWIVPVNNGATGAPPVPPKNITADNPASDSTPLYSPDGKYIAYRAQQRAGYESDRFRLMLYDRKTGKKKNLTEDFDKWVGTFTWSLFSTRIFFNTEDQGKSPVFSVLVATGERLEVPLLTMATADDLVVAPNGQDILFTNNSIEEPNAIYGSLLCPNGRDNPCGHLPPPPSHNLTLLNDDTLSQVAMSPIEPFWFPGAFGDKVQGFLVKPPNFDLSKKYPLKFIIHGGPEVPMGDMWSYRWNAELFAASGYVVIMINFHGSPGYGQKFIDEINGDWGGAPFEDLMKGLDYAEKTYPFVDKDRECALGASY